MRINESNYDILKKVSDVTMTTYDIKWFNEEEGFVDEENLLTMIEDLLVELHTLEEKIEDLEKDIEDNYKPIPISEQVGISDRDFI